MATVRAYYLGNLKVECEHLDSKTKIVTSAPKDNNGDGASFSPTDLCCTALASCAMTIMAIKAQQNGFTLNGLSADITKIMGQDPRYIAKIEIVFSIAGSFREDQKMLLQEAAESCPVCLTLGDKTEQIFTYNWLE